MKSIIIGASGALLTGIAIGLQATISSRVGSLIGSVRTGLLTNFLGGTLAGIIVLALIIFEGRQNWKIPPTLLVVMSASGLLGILIITGVSFSIQRAGLAAGLATIILGQMLVSIVFDTRGIGGAEPIALSFQRITGILLLGVSVYLLLPKK